MTVASAKCIKKNVPRSTNTTAKPPAPMRNYGPETNGAPPIASRNGKPTCSAPAWMLGRNNIAAIQAKVCEHYGITMKQLLSRIRTQRISWVRQVAMYLAHQHGWTLLDCAKGFKRDVATVKYSSDCVGAAMCVYEDVRTEIQALANSFGSEV